MTINLYTISDDPDHLTKHLSAADVRQGAVRDDHMSIDHPVITVTGSVTGSNYAYIADFGRYYYITDRDIKRTGLTTLTLQSDPLMSFRDQILNCPAVLSRSDGIENSYLPDSQLPTLSYQQESVLTFSAMQYFAQYILVVVG